ncbi:hypothetical protein LCGC14_2881970, partial [marine sediment metagenome]
TSVCSYLQILILVIILRRRLGSLVLQGMLSATAKTVAATILMAAVGAGLLALMRNLPLGFWSDILRLVVVVPSAAAVYLLAARLLQIEELALLTGGKQTV